MRFFCAALAAALALIWLGPDDAAAQDRRTKKVTKHRVVEHGRSPSVGPNGLCQRDTGTPNSELNFRNKCDVEEFWARIQGRGSDGTR